MRRDPHTGAPDFFRFARDYKKKIRRKRLRPTGSAWSASWTTSPRPSTSDVSTSASITSNAST